MPRRRSRGSLRTGFTVPPLMAMIGVMATGVAACGGSTGGSGAGESPIPTTSVPVSANVVAPPGPVDRTAVGTGLAFGASAFLPADPFRPTGRLAMYTITGVEPGTVAELPADLTSGGRPFYVHVTVTPLADRQIPSIVGLAGSADGRTATLTRNPPADFPRCVATTPAANPRRGASYATCFVAVADPGSVVNRVIYWAQTSNDPAVDYKSAPVVWSAPGAGAPSSPSPATS